MLKTFYEMRWQPYGQLLDNKQKLAGSHLGSFLMTYRNWAPDVCPEG